MFRAVLVNWLLTLWLTASIQRTLDGRAEIQRNKFIQLNQLVIDSIPNVVPTRMREDRELLYQ